MGNGKDFVEQIAHRNFQGLDRDVRLDRGKANRDTDAALNACGLCYRFGGRPEVNRVFPTC